MSRCHPSAALAVPPLFRRLQTLHLWWCTTCVTPPILCSSRSHTLRLFTLPPVLHYCCSALPACTAHTCSLSLHNHVSYVARLHLPTLRDRLSFVHCSYTALTCLRTLLVHCAHTRPRHCYTLCMHTRRCHYRSHLACALHCHCRAPRTHALCRRCYTRPTCALHRRCCTLHTRALCCCCYTRPASALRCRCCTLRPRALYCYCCAHPASALR